MQIGRTSDLLAVGKLIALIAGILLLVLFYPTTQKEESDLLTIEGFTQEECLSVGGATFFYASLPSTHYIPSRCLVAREKALGEYLPPWGLSFYEETQ